MNSEKCCGVVLEKDAFAHLTCNYVVWAPHSLSVALIAALVTLKLDVICQATGKSNSNKRI